MGANVLNVIFVVGGAVAVSRMVFQCLLTFTGWKYGHALAHSCFTVFAKNKDAVISKEDLLAGIYFAHFLLNYSWFEFMKWLWAVKIIHLFLFTY